MGTALIETIVRASGLAPEIVALDEEVKGMQYETIAHPILIYVPKTGSRGINSLGFRGPESSVVKAKGTYRIVLLGDSMAFGYCVAGVLTFESTLGHLLEQDLNRYFSGKPNIEILNLAVSGYSARDEVAFFDLKGADLRPDLVVVQYCFNDEKISSLELGTFSSSPIWSSIRNQNLRARVIPLK